MTDWRAVQQRLKMLGFDPGPIDGIRGPKTDAAIVAFKKSIGFRARPYFGPLTEAALWQGADHDLIDQTALPWLDIARGVMGLHERRDTARLRSWFDRSVSWIDPRETPWCFTGDVEIMTEQGWQRLDSLTATRVYQVDEGGRLSLTDYRKVEKPFFGKIKKVEHRSFTLRCDPDHRWWGSWGYYGRNKAKRSPTFGVLDDMKGAGLFIENPLSGASGCGLTEEQLTLAAAALSDGSFRRDSNGKPRDIVFEVSKERKVAALHSLRPDHHYRQAQAYGPITTKPLDVFRFSVPAWMHAVISDEKQIDPDFINSLSVEDARAFLRAYAMFDGTPEKNTLHTSCARRRDDLLMIAVLAGYGTGVNTKASPLSKRPCYDIRLRVDGKPRHIRPRMVSEEMFSGRLYCVTVPTSRIVVREHGRGAVVTGNCGAFVATCLRQWRPDVKIPDNPLGARNWQRFGMATGPQLGAVMVFWRGTRQGWKGHVGFYWGEDDTHYHVLGGNQSNAVTITRVSKHRLLGARWPAGYSQPKKIVRLSPSGAPVTTNEA